MTHWVLGLVWGGFVLLTFSFRACNMGFGFEVVRCFVGYGY